MKPGTQVVDQTGKGVMIGAVAVVLADTNLDPTVRGAIITLAAALLAWLSTLIGNRTVASFLTK